MNEDSGPASRSRAPRLLAYDYSTVGAYFITICIRDRCQLLGRLEGESVFLSPAGAMVQAFWQALPEQLLSVRLDTFLVMPDHFHGIIVLNDHDAPPTAPERNTSLPLVIKAFKSRTTVAYGRGVGEEGWPRYALSLWQSSYFDHVIRSDAGLNRVRRYIEQNPQRSSLKLQV
jgi:putative transposase